MFITIWPHNLHRRQLYPAPKGRILVTVIIFSFLNDKGTKFNMFVYKLRWKDYLNTQTYWQENLLTAKTSQLLSLLCETQHLQLPNIWCFSKSVYFENIYFSMFNKLQLKTGDTECERFYFFRTTFYSITLKSIMKGHRTMSKIVVIRVCKKINKYLFGWNIINVLDTFF